MCNEFEDVLISLQNQLLHSPCQQWVSPSRVIQLSFLKLKSENYGLQEHSLMQLKVF